MNEYTILMYDGYSSHKQMIVGYDIPQAIQNAGVIASQVIKVELTGTQNS